MIIFLLAQKYKLVDRGNWVDLHDNPNVVFRCGIWQLLLVCDYSQGQDGCSLQHLFSSRQHSINIKRWESINQSMTAAPLANERQQISIVGIIRCRNSAGFDEFVVVTVL
ncbi:hypothetical protein SeMB42_g04899 [Synchytrium endobioticum]|uniref:Uncharacterized protein n=1 Tax=Synchytrium endobioticum TaxID=286115 RepID=A0A507CUX6_9FUNG|nr:hypothetical protein SeMB42_g04899 [Synchytrium endobioticum]